MNNLQGEQAQRESTCQVAVRTVPWKAVCIYSCNFPPLSLCYQAYLSLAAFLLSNSAKPAVPGHAHVLMELSLCVSVLYTVWWYFRDGPWAADIATLVTRPWSRFHLLSCFFISPSILLLSEPDSTVRLTIRVRHPNSMYDTERMIPAFTKNEDAFVKTTSQKLEKHERLKWEEPSDCSQSAALVTL